MTEYIVRETRRGQASMREIVCELVRCKDCVHYEISRLKKDGTDDKRYKRTACVNGATARYRPPDWYCADAERRTDA